MKQGPYHRHAELAIEEEQHRQIEKWGIQHHDNEKWLAILMEEVGEAIREHLNGNPDAFLEELIQVAAVAHTWLEDRLGA